MITLDDALADVKVFVLDELAFKQEDEADRGVVDV